MSGGEGSRSLYKDERGQMLQDYTIGITLFLLATVFAVAFLPSIFTPYSAPVNAAQTEQADRVANEILAEITMDESPQTLDESATNSFFSSDLDDMDLSRGTDVHVTLVDGEGDEMKTVGPDHEGHSTAATTRIVLDDEAGSQCPDTETCRVEVRVWR